MGRLRIGVNLAVLTLCLLWTGAALAQPRPPPPGGPPPGAPPPMNDGAQHRPPPPPPPPPPRAQDFAPVPIPGEPLLATPAAPAAVVAPVPVPAELPAQADVEVPWGAMATSEAAPGSSREDPAREQTRTADGIAPAVIANETTVARLPRWLWLLAAACLLLLLAWRASLRKSSSLSAEKQRLTRDQRQLQSAHSQLKTQSEHLRHLAIHDPLTGTLNRQAFATELKVVLDHLSRFRRPLNLILFDLDHFKQINDQLGHLVGDSALRLVVGVVRQHLASEDLFARFGGDEFLVACADQPIAQTAELAESIRTAVVREAAAQVPPMLGLSLSIGIAQANPETGYSPEDLFLRADTALYTAKNAGRNRVVLADESLAPPPVLQAATRHLS